jgi:predicted nucleic acid-binding protein
MIFLDTSVLIDYYRKQDKTKSFLHQLAQIHTDFAVSVVVEYEVFHGIKLTQQPF